MTGPGELRAEGLSGPSGGCPTQGPKVGDALAVHLKPRPESFEAVCYAEIEAAPYWQPGVCFNAVCGRRFDPSRVWQKFCCRACQAAWTAEARRWGLLMAPALLVWRMGKYAPADTPEGARTRAARAFLTRTQTAWLQERRGAA